MANSQGFPIQYRTRSVFGGREGNLWIGRSGGGLCRFRDGTFSCYSRLDGLPSELIRVITQDRFHYTVLSFVATDGSKTTLNLEPGTWNSYVPKTLKHELHTR